MSKYERIVHIPSVVISESTVQTVDNLLDALAEERVSAVLEDYARNYYRAHGHSAPAILSGAIPAGMSEDGFVQATCANEGYRSLVRLGHGARYTYLSPHGNVQYVGENFSQDDIPKDVEMVIAEANGASDRLLSLNLKARTQPLEIGNPNVNRVLIQSGFADRAWVNNLYEQLAQLAEGEKNIARHIIYKYMPIFVWAAFFAMVVLEYKIAGRLSGFHWRQPLNGLQLLIVFVLLALDLLAAGLLFVRVLPYCFPYFEFEGNLSRKRIALRKPVQWALGALYTSAVVALVKAWLF